MEWVAYLAGEKHSDHPACVSYVLRLFCVTLNDGLGNEDRQRLRPYLTRTIGTADDGFDAERTRLCRQFVNVYGQNVRRWPCLGTDPEMRAAYIARRYPRRLPQVLDLLDRMLPTVPLELPVAEDAEQVCGVA